MTSSYELAGHKAVCPGESVTFFCTAQETYSISFFCCDRLAQWLAEDINMTDARVQDRQPAFTAILTSVVPNGSSYDMIATLTTFANLNSNGSMVVCEDSSSSRRTAILSLAGEHQLSKISCTI